MLNKEQIIRILKEYDLDTNNYIVISGSAMVLLGIKDTTNDIDISVTKEYYDYLLTNYDCNLERINENNNKIYYIDKKINFGYDYYSFDSLKIEGIPVQKLDDIIKLKESLNRKKDQKDLELLRKNRQSVEY